ncbi:DUF2470 domain-containing protein [Saccharopolyspora taberi]|uniref:DUF2470 domain-containing protein n=1 Tax=Saccharopolyspora taberi TaxID=60895 RepID=A0ABN3VF95_9PSEU
MSKPNPFDQQVVDAVVRHMNEDHAADSLLIVRALGGLPEATSATATGVDGEAISFDAQAGEGGVEVRIPWSRPLTERAEIRAEVVRMHREACDILGVPPRTGGDHQ